MVGKPKAPTGPKGLSKNQIQAIDMLLSPKAWTQNHIADTVGVSRSTFHRWLTQNGTFMAEYAKQVKKQTEDFERGLENARVSALGVVLGALDDHDRVTARWVVENRKVPDPVEDDKPKGKDVKDIPDDLLLKLCMAGKDPSPEIQHLIDLYGAIEIDREYVDRYGFYGFVQLAWWHADGSVYQDAPHIRAIAGELEAAIRARHEGKGCDLGVALPPGASKSMLLSVLLQPWAWIWWPESTWITAAYDDPLAHRLSSKSRTLVEGDWYQERWPLGIKTSQGRFWENAKGGKRIAVGIGSRITGEHGHVVLLDDPVKEQLTRLGTPAQISAAVAKAVDFWFGTLSTRVVDYVAARILIHQRLHVDDPIGVAQRDHGYRVITYPARFDPDRADDLDHRKVKGEILCERMTEEALFDLEIRLGPRAAAAQLDQNPVPLGGQLLKDEYLSHRYGVLPSDIQRTIESGVAGPGQRWITAWDLTFKGKPTSDFVVGQVWVAYEAGFYVIDQIRRQMGYMDTKQAMRDLAASYPWITAHVVEDAANAAAIDDDLGNEIPGIVMQSAASGCLARTQKSEGLWASGAVKIPEDAAWVGGSEGFVAEHLGFDGLGTRHDDQVSASSLALVHLHSLAGSQWIAAMKAAAKEQ